MFRKTDDQLPYQVPNLRIPYSTGLLTNKDAEAEAGLSGTFNDRIQYPPIPTEASISIVPEVYSADTLN